MIPEIFQMSLQHRRGKCQAGEPLRLKVEDETAVEARPTRRLLQTHALATSAATGLARQTLKLDRAP